jgi:hypothetical protein
VLQPQRAKCLMCLDAAGLRFRGSLGSTIATPTNPEGLPKTSRHRKNKPRFRQTC